MHPTQREIYRGESMTAKTRIPNFRSEKEEAQWWDAHPEVITELFMQAKKEGKIRRLPVVRGATKPVTIRMPVVDIESAQRLAEQRGLDRKSTRLNSSHLGISYAVFC